MITDISIREQGYGYFLAEAPELLQIIEQELFSLSEGYSTAKVHNLMRATHTIKGGAANVGLDVIKMIAHSLEDVFKALYSPDVVIDAELQTLLLQAYECLSLALTAELTANTINSEELLQRSTTVFAQLQEKLGDAFGADAHIPTSEELGFDIVQSIFEVGVQQRLESIAETINNPPDNAEFVNFLRSQAEVFLGLAQSLGLPGLGEIAQTLMAALAANPSQVLQIAEITLADLQQAHTAVLAGDRTNGGTPSASWQTLTTSAINELSITPVSTKSFATTFLSNTADFYKFLTIPGKIKNEPIKPANAKFYLKVIRYIFGWFNHYMEIPESQLSLTLLIPQAELENPVNYVENWLKKFLAFVQDQEDSQSLRLYRQGVILIILLAVAKFQYSVEQANSAIPVIKTLRKHIRQSAKKYKNSPPVTAEEKNWLGSPKLQKLLVFKEVSNPISAETNDSLLESIWGEESSLDMTDDEVAITQTVEDVRNDDYLESVTSSVISEQIVTNISETAIEIIPDYTTQINQQIEDKSLPSLNKRSRQPSFVRVDVEGLQRLNYLTGELLIYQKRRSLQNEQIQELIERLTQQLTRHQTILNQLRDLPLQRQNVALQNTQNVAAVNFDSLEMDAYTEFQLTLHEAIEETLQLQETTESLDLLVSQASQISDKTHSLTLGIIDNLVEARMLPLGNILNRFSQMVTKLGKVYRKLVELKLGGTQVLVDKAIAEKLYDPLLHLVRNAFDHGIEPPQMRRDLGKPEQGLIEIRAYNQGSQTVIEVRDDGQGLNLESVRKRAIELRLIPSDDEAGGYVHNPTEAELLELMFSPGFSTAGKVSEISGRGMGLDIVRTQLQGLNGSISVQSLPNQGTTFLLKIPFSMTTDKLMLVQAGGVVYAMLLDSIEKILIPSAQQIREFEGKKVLHWNTDQDEQIVSLRKLADLMYYNGSLLNTTTLDNIPTKADTAAMKNPVLLLRRNLGIMGLEVDQIIGEQELVIRPLGNAIAPPKYVYGCSSLANGNLILIIDGTLLVESREMQATLEPRSSKKSALSISGYLTSSTPLLAASAATDTREIQPGHYVEATHKSPKVVLVVDDAISLRQTLSLTLQKSGYQVIQAQNGVEALEQLQLHPEIEVVISDLEMPRMNGFELLSSIRQSQNLAKMPVVILTSRSAEKHRQLAQELGATAYLTKPYLEHEFISIVNGLSNRYMEQLNTAMINP
ncbi:hybrid sensor histidine kinase/response regulator [Cylindrospermum sp. FACHB-282]|uniref:hybrid sensor histidine kinase/response regulator n=1 Tax=Cylindrospermum sp. FACHB-282 TaxID=2692794 RepID=UPI0016846587|nr:hybrid sensor histidine kinase/response regulator [Cylindrospermum sp. FACHB-282]MBD2387157.1 hybrid sensor histidine kinase/response regulator [Cylindrospermum sp. FACHB-282]